VRNLAAEEEEEQQQQQEEEEEEGSQDLVGEFCTRKPDHSSPQVPCLQEEVAVARRIIR
jgi:hypothetical protein